MTKTTVIYHSADFDGIFCREIARQRLGLEGVDYIGWNFGDRPLKMPDGQIVILDLPVDRVFGYDFWKPEIFRLPVFDRLTWIDHHKSSIESHPKDIPGYRLDGVAACRLAWQWFFERGRRELPEKADYGVLLPDGKRTAYRVSEPWAVRLAGEYDVWDKRDPDADTFQFGLRGMDPLDLPWEQLLTVGNTTLALKLIEEGSCIERYQRRMDAQMVEHRSFDVFWEGGRFLALNTARCNSKTFEAAAMVHHDGLIGFYWNGKVWTVSLYHAPHRREADLSKIALRYGGGGHAGACGFKCEQLPWSLTQVEVGKDANAGKEF